MISIFILIYFSKLLFKSLCAAAKRPYCNIYHAYVWMIYIHYV